MSKLRLRIDDKSKKFIRAVEYYGGEATTTQIRQRSGLSKSEVKYRFDKLEDLGLIDSHRAEDGYGDRTPPKVAVLTNEGETRLGQGLLKDVREEDDETPLEEKHEALVERVIELERRLDVLTQHGGSSGN